MVEEKRLSWDVVKDATAEVEKPLTPEELR